jgi:membrane protein DedA with SNARE-associated domain
MDWLLTDQNTLSVWLMQYGSIALFGLLALGIIALPVPEETLMVLAGILLANDRLYFVPTFIAAYAGSACGISVSYFVGYTAGNYVLNKYGSRVGLTEAKHQLIHNWFRRFGKWPLFFGYFIPGIRHFTGFIAGISYLKYQSFALYAYSGAIVWVSTFLSIGYFFGDYWVRILSFIDLNLIEFLVIILCFIATYLFVRFFLKKKS